MYYETESKIDPIHEDGKKGTPQNSSFLSWNHKNSCNSSTLIHPAVYFYL